MHNLERRLSKLEPSAAAGRLFVAKGRDSAQVERVFLEVGAGPRDVTIWLRVVAPGLLVVPLGWTSLSLPLAMAAYALYVVAFGALLFLLRLVTIDELRTLQRQLRGVPRSRTLSEPAAD